MESKSTIKIEVQLDDQKIPDAIHWEASADQGGKQEIKAFLLSLWDPKEESAMRLDLWTKDMRVDEMDKMVFQTMMTLADSYERATKNTAGAADIRAFGKAFGKKTEVIK